MRKTDQPANIRHHLLYGRHKLWLSLCNSRLVLQSAALALGLSLMPVGALAEIRLIFGTYAADKPTETVRAMKPFLNYLGQELSKRFSQDVMITTQIAVDYDKGIADLVNGEVDFARFGPASYVTAKDINAGIQILAMEAVNGQKTFKGIITVRQDSDIQDLADLRGRTFAFGNRLSTIGRYLAQKQLLDVGIDAGSLRSFDFLGRHDRVGTAVGKGDFDAGALKSSTFKKLLAKNVPLRAISSFDNVTKPWISRAGLDADMILALREVLLQVSDPQVLKSIKKSGFLPGDDTDYDVIREAILQSRAFGG
jgi:phosphate/phosphite/phosphonate ABC transporter binding protein